VVETADKETQGDQPPEAVQQGASSRVPAIVVSISALAVIGAATANSLPNYSLSNFALSNFSLSNFSLPNYSLPNFSLPNFSLPNFPNFSLPKFSLPNFSLPHFSSPNFDRFVAPAPHQTASAPTPEAVVSATLKDIQLSQQQNAAVLVSLAQSSAAQQADLRRISRQLSSLSAQTEALQNAMSPLTTSSIPHSNARARFVRASRKIIPLLPKPVGPVSVGGAPLSPAPPPGTGTGA
jgi:hypothetical protein